MPRIFIDGKPCEAAEGKNLLETCLSLGLDLPYFCWHPALGSVGACRQCAVIQYKDAQDTRGKIVMACMTPIEDGLRASISSPPAREFRASVIEWLMTSHPHDCPVCDEGGECHLQDMTVMTGHTRRRFRFRKRTHRNQDLGPFVNHEMNRCIACYRCVRFYREYAGGRDLNVFAAHDHVYFGRHEDGRLENEFSGNLIEVCPTGVFTDKRLKKHYVRKWDLQTAPSVCPHCSLGCNTIPGEHAGHLRRVRNRYHPDINGYFLCDRGRFGYEFVNGENRLREAWFRGGRNARIEPLPPAEIAARLGEPLRAPETRSRAIGIGSPRASVEANFALRTLVGAERYFSGISDLESDLLEAQLRILKENPLPAASIRDIENSDAVLVLGEDVLSTAPRIALALRQAVRNAPLAGTRSLGIPEWQDAAIREAIQGQNGPLFIAGPFRSGLEDIATESWKLAPQDVARLGFAVAHALDEGFPEVPILNSELAEAACRIASALSQARCPVVISGAGLRSRAVQEAAASVAWALKARLCLAAPEANSVGLGLLGGRPLSEAFAQMAEGAVETVIVLENDLFRRSESSLVRDFLARAHRVILVDHSANAVVPRADALLPCATWVESTGTFVNNEARAQRFFQVFKPAEETIRESWRWLRDLSIAAGVLEAGAWDSLDELHAALVSELPALLGIAQAAPSAAFRIGGRRIARQSHRVSGRTALHADRNVHEPRPPEDPDSPFAFSMEGFQGEPPPALIPRYWAPGWNSVQALNRFQQEIGGPLRGETPGKLLLEPGAGAAAPFREMPTAFRPRPGQWLALPLHHFFGSEELSRLSPATAGLAPRSYFALNPEDAGRLGFSEGDPVTFQLGNGQSQVAPLRLDPALPPGTVGIPVGLPEQRGNDALLPAWGAIGSQARKEAA